MALDYDQAELPNCHGSPASGILSWNRLAPCGSESRVARVVRRRRVRRWCRRRLRHRPRGLEAGAALRLHGATTVYLKVTDTVLAEL